MVSAGAPSFFGFGLENIDVPTFWLLFWSKTHILYLRVSGSSGALSCSHSLETSFDLDLDARGSSYYGLKYIPR